MRAKLVVESLDSSLRAGFGLLLGLGSRGAPGQPPGTVKPPEDAPAPQLHVFGYSENEIEEAELEDLGEIGEWRDKWPVIWLDIRGIGDGNLIKRVGEEFNLHPLALEDVAGPHQRPKLEEFEDHVFVVLKMLMLRPELDIEQASIFIGDGFVVTFQEREGDCLDPVRNRIRKKKGRIRKAGADYLGYAVIDAIVDGYFPVLEHYGDRLEEVEESILARPTASTVGEVHGIRRELLGLRRAAWPMRDVMSRLQRDDIPVIQPDTRLYLRDTSDHAVQLLDVIETFRELAGGLLEIYLSSLGHRQNEVMKVLTIIATIFIPLSFIAGVYGMNFSPTASPLNMPELEWYFGYPFALGLMALTAGGLVVFFVRKGWLGGD